MMIEQPYLPVPANSFLKFCETAQKIAETRGSKTKTRIFADYLTQLNDEKDIELASQFLGEGAFSRISGRRASIGHRTASVAAAAFCEIDYEMVFKPCRTALGSASETMEKLMFNIPEASAKRRPRPFSLKEIEEEFTKLEQARKRGEKEKLLLETWGHLTALEIKFYYKVLGQGTLRIGFETKSIINSIAEAFGKELEQVRYAHMITGNLGKAALLSKRDELYKAEFKMFQPLSFMLALPLENVAGVNLNEYIAEEKFDGMRCQIHINENKVALYSRDLNEITHMFPELVDVFLRKKLKNTVLDGEICVYKNDTIQPFLNLQKRMGLKKPSKAILQDYPVIFISYDVLYINVAPVFSLKVPERRELLEALCAEHQIAITNQFDPLDERYLEERFKQALVHGNEGLMLKKIDSTYEYGHRGKSWLKVKKPGGSIDTVIMYATAGSGKRGGTYSDFTLGINVKDDERYEEEFIPIGKAYGGYTDAELKQLNQEIRPLVVERFGPTLSLKPGIVVEIEFDGIQVNKRTKAGYTLRLPRFKAIRWDLSPNDANTLEDVEKIYQLKLDEYREEQDGSGSFRV
ncbi:MAG: ATP-dependent DNA ligase [Balneolales bacterium]